MPASKQDLPTIGWGKISKALNAFKGIVSSGPVKVMMQSGRYKKWKLKIILASSLLILIILLKNKIQRHNHESTKPPPNSLLSMVSYRILWLEYMVNVYREQLNRTNKAQNSSQVEPKIVVLVYGSYYNEVLLEDLVDGYCSNSTHIKVIRSHTCVDHDAVILHFIEYDNFLRQCVEYPYQKKKTMVIFAMVLTF
ncbi:hypothetical protein RF11_11900 [Thelohanellus kitauei]|uniref:Uncharacterized protein n=1 Tax=Thelohanellus kitauei TaxID=669202 RepID=A0A0C2ND47_THEKT|nr:hypothetical protein RF11_11900 [Thelohanellus kitauei]